MPHHVVDVLIPTYNPKPEHLTEALRSLQAQEFQSWKALIHDDCSETDVRAIVMPFLSDARIRFVRSDTRRGIGGNWNACLNVAQAEFVAFFFQDDLWAPDYLSEGIRALQDNATVGFVSLEHEYKIEDATLTPPNIAAIQEFHSAQTTSGKQSGTELLRKWLKQGLSPNIIGEPSFVILRRDAVHRAGLFLEDMSQLLDVEYWTRLLTLGDWYCIRGNFGAFRVHESGASAMNQESGRGLHDRLRCFEILIQTLPPHEASVALKARERALTSMMTRFRSRVTSGKKVSAESSTELKKFCLRHPLLILKAIVLSYISGK